jgi:hypothetical protein
MRKSSRILLLLVALLPQSALAQNGRIEADKGDVALVINGWIGEENSFTGNLRLTLLGAAQGTNPVKPILLFSDLKQVGGTEVIGRQQVTVTGDQTLTPDVPSTYQVKVTGVKAAGEYRGKLELLLPGQPRADAEGVDAQVVKAKVVDVTVHAKFRPGLTPVAQADRVQASLVRCSGGCELARLLLPAGHFQNRIELRFEKPLPSPLVISDMTFVVKGDQARFNLTPEQFRVALNEMSASGPSAGPGENDAPRAAQEGAGPANPAAGDGAQTFDDKKYVRLPVILDSSAISADHYTGSIYLTVAGQSGVIKVPVDLNVRIGPYWPLLILLASIILGRLFKFMQDKGNAKADALEAINRVAFRARDAHPDDVAIISPMLDEARDLVFQDRAAETSAAASAVATRLVMLNELRQIEARLSGKEQIPAVQQIRSDIRLCRERVGLKQDAEAKALLDRIKEALVSLLTALTETDSDPDADISDAVRRADSAADAAGSLLRRGASGRRRFRDFLITLSGLSDELRAEATLFVARPLLWLVLLLGLVALGMKTLYVDNPVFGVNLFADMLGLIFWGISSDVASRTLSGLQLPNAPAPVTR